MKGQENLIPFSERTVEEQRKIAIMGGKASGEARRKKKTMKECYEYLMNSKYKGDISLLEQLGIEKEEMSNKMAMITQMYLEVMNKKSNNRVQAFNSLMKFEEGIIDNQTATMPTININVVDNSNLEETMYKEH